MADRVSACRPAVGDAVAAVMLRRGALALLFACLVVDNPQERSFGGAWQSPLSGLGSFLFDNLNKATGIEALRFAGLDLILAVLTIAAALRTNEVPHKVAMPKPLRSWLFGYAAVIVWLFVLGMARGGSFKNSLWQLREMVWLPAVALIFDASFRSERDFRAVGKVIVVAALCKVGLGTYFLLVVVPTLVRKPSFVTTHADSVLLVTSLFIVIAEWAHLRDRRTFWACCWVVPPVLFGLVINNRRLAFVSLSCGLVVIYRLLPSGRRRVVTRAGIALLPLGLCYVVLGRNHSDVFIFKPAAAVASVFLQTDRSSGMRDVENYNLIQTIKRHPWIGSGFGHEYVEEVRADDISADFPLYRYIGHNSVLWWWGVAGLLGFAVSWMFLAVGLFFAARARAFARTPKQHSAASICAAVILAYLVQAYGDMGLQSWISLLLVSLAIVCSGKLAVETGAWQKRARANGAGAGAALSLQPKPAAAGETA